MLAWLSVLVLAGGGLAFLGTAWRARSSGELRAGRNGFRAHRVSRSESPGSFYFFQLLYVIFGSWLLIHGVRVALGWAAPLPLY
jgi:hypothetical protein